jgi:hypothetical protein
MLRQSGLLKILLLRYCDLIWKSSRRVFITDSCRMSSCEWMNLNISDHRNFISWYLATGSQSVIITKCSQMWLLKIRTPRSRSRSSERITMLKYLYIFLLLMLVLLLLFTIFSALWRWFLFWWLPWLLVFSRFWIVTCTSLATWCNWIYLRFF